MQAQSSEELEESEGGDTFELDIKVSNPEKVGTGMSTYIAFTVATLTTMPQFKHPKNSVKRRFSDFLGLHQRLTDKHLDNGRIVPPAPEKSMMGQFVFPFRAFSFQHFSFLFCASS